jgi:Flp pilus assembly protein TadD
MNEGNDFAGLDQYSEAIDSYDKAIALIPVDAVAWNNRGVVLDTLKLLPRMTRQ